jgi:predicted unusual protein kinase regulating ubiquinone biosynthesis (AarF/ABC1/UbiB family)
MSSKKTKSSASIPTSVTARGLEFLKMGAKFAAQARPLSEGVASLFNDKKTSDAEGSLNQDLARRLAQARILVEGLSKLKGAAMKLGQTVSVELRDLLPPEVVEALSQLQDQGTPLSSAEVRRILVNEWGPRSGATVAQGQARLNGLESWGEAPLASASIGQVHAARIAGSDVVLKVQFPGIGDTIESDIRGLGLLLRGFFSVTGRAVDVEPLLEELGSVFRQETDYLSEAAFLKEYADGIAAFSGYRVPSVFSEWSTSRVLVMSRERGLRPLDWLRLRQPPASVRNAVGQRFLDLYEIEFFRMGLVQTDPNFANFLIDDSHDRENPVITLLDFGAMKRFDPIFRSQYRELLRAARSDEKDLILERAFEMGILRRDECLEAQEALVKLLRASLSPFDPRNQPFAFTDAEYARQMRELGFALAKACRTSPPPRAILFLHRKLGGIFNLLKAMEVTLDLTSYWNRIVQSPPSV